MDYKITKLKSDFEIEGIVTVHYYEYHKDYMFLGESHDFWELLYVDKGEVTVCAGEKYIVISKGEMIFHAPDEFHMVIANGVIAPNLVVVAFNCHSRAMDFFCGKIVTLNENCKKHVGRIVSEAKNAFSNPLDDPATKEMCKRDESKFGCEQLIGIYLQLLLIEIVRNDSTPAISSTIHQKYNSEMYVKIIEYIEDNLENNITLSSIAEHFSFSLTSIKSLFKEYNDMGVKEYMRLLRIEHAKRMIREETMNFTEISDKLGFSSIHYFSRAFKRQTGMSPSEYATSVKVLVDGEEEPPQV